MNTMMAALKKFDATEANLEKLERLWRELASMIPQGLSFGLDDKYEDVCRAYIAVLAALPAIDGWKPTALPLDLNEIAQHRFDAMEVDEPSAHISVENWISEPGRELREYRHRFTLKRRSLVRNSLITIMKAIDESLAKIQPQLVGVSRDEKVLSPIGDTLKSLIDQIEVLLGSTIAKPARWPDLRRHLHFRCVGDYLDIISNDWPAVKNGIEASFYSENEPLPVEADDLNDLVEANPQGRITLALN